MNADEREMTDAEQLRIQIVGGLARVEGRIESLTAVLKATNDRARDEIGELFRRSNDDTTRIGIIERDYVPHATLKEHTERDDRDHGEFRAAMLRHEAENRREIEALRLSIDALKMQVTRILAIGGAVWMALTAVLQVAMKAWM